MRKNSSSFPVEIVTDAFGSSTKLAEVLSGASKVLIVADLNVVMHSGGLGTKIGRYFQDHGIKLACNPVILAGGEKMKFGNFQGVIRVVDAAINAKLCHTDVILAIGGGTVLDVAGYVAAQIRGGVRLVRMPTTPTSMLASPFSPYAAIDTANVKDALRVTSTPSAVVIDPTFARSVLDGVWRTGLGSAVRIAVANDATLLKKVIKYSSGYAAYRMDALIAIVEAVTASVAKKGQNDMALWIAHRLEAMSDFKVPYGYAVIIGLLVELNAAVLRKCIDDEDCVQIIDTFKSCGSLDGLSHAKPLLARPKDILYGIDAWLLMNPDGIPELVKIGKSVPNANPDRAIYETAFAKVLELAASVAPTETAETSTADEQ